MAQLAIRVEQADQVDIFDSRSGQLFGIPQTSNAITEFRQFLGMIGFEKVTASTGMGINNPERRGLFCKIAGRKQQDQVFENVGVIAGVESVAVTQHAASFSWREAGDCSLLA